MRIRPLVAALAAATVLAVGAAPADAATTAEPVKLDRSPTAAEWEAGRVACLLTVTGRTEKGELLHGDPECWLVDPADKIAPWERSLEGVSALFSIVGTHYDGEWFAGSYISVSGTVCSGGWLNLSWDWIDRIGSTSSPCWVGHYDGYNLTGSNAWTNAGNLGFMNNRSNSLVYV